jgi:predicted transcriptional regulator
MPKFIKREYPEYDRNALVNNEPRDLIPIEKTFKVVIKESKKEDKKVNKNLSRIDRNPVLKNRLIHLFLSGLYSNREIARMLCISPSAVTKYLKREDVQTSLEVVQKEESKYINSKLYALRDKAVDTLGELMDCNNEQVALNAAKEILDKTGHGTIQKQEVNVNLTYEERLKKLAEPNYSIDAEYEQINTEREDKDD